MGLASFGKLLFQMDQFSCGRESNRLDFAQFDSTLREPPIALPVAQESLMNLVQHSSLNIAADANSEST